MVIFIQRSCKHMKLTYLFRKMLCCAFHVYYGYGKRFKTAFGVQTVKCAGKNSNLNEIIN